MVKVRDMPTLEKIVILGSPNVIPFLYLFISDRKEKVHIGLFVSPLDTIMCSIIYHFSSVFISNAVSLL